MKGVIAIKVPLVIGKSKEALGERSFKVRLFFVADSVGSDEVFDIRVQGKDVFKDFDVSKEAGEKEKMIVKEIRGVLAGRDLLVEFTPKKGKASISGLEIIAE